MNQYYIDKLSVTKQLEHLNKRNDKNCAKLAFQTTKPKLKKQGCIELTVHRRPRGPATLGTALPPYIPQRIWEGLAYLWRGRGGSEEWGRGQAAADPGGRGAIAPVRGPERIFERIGYNNNNNNNDRLTAFDPGQPG